MRRYFTAPDLDDPTKEEILYVEDHTLDPSPHELYKIYQPSAGMLRKLLSLQRKEREEFLAQKKEIEESLARKVPFRDLEFAVELVWAGTLRARFEKLEAIIAVNEAVLRLIPKKRRVVQADGSTKLVEFTRRDRTPEVLAIPITDFLQFNRAGFGRCPFHGDRHPSMKYYKRENRVHCFSGCGQKNVIQIYALLHNMDTKAAFKELLNRL